MKFSKKLHRIALKNIKEGTDPHRDAFVSNCGLFAVHRDFTSDYYTLTHLPTGHAFGVGIFYTAKNARDFCKEIYPLIDWSKVKVKVKQKMGVRTSETFFPKGVDGYKFGQKIKQIREDYL